LNCWPKFLRPFAPIAVSAACLGESDEIDRRQRTSVFRIADFLLLESHFSEAVILEHHDFTGRAFASRHIVAARWWV
jgi:hypothetical protein